MYNMDDLMGFVEWLPNNSELFADLDVEATIAQINKLASSDEGKETLEQLTKQYKSKEMELFKKGGKLDYLLCLKKGGKVQDCGCGKKIEKAATGSSGVADGDWDDYHTIINAPGDTLRFKQYFSGPAYMQTHPEGGTTYERSTRDGVTRMYGDGYQPNWWERNILGYQPVTSEEKENWEQLIKNHANDPAVKDKTKRKGILKLLGISKKQPGGEIPDMVSVYPIRRWDSTGFFSGDKTASLKAYDPKQRFLGVDYDNDSLGYLNRTISGNDTTYVGKGLVADVLMGKPVMKIKATSKNPDDPNLPRLRAIFKQFGD